MRRWWREVVGDDVWWLTEQMQSVQSVFKYLISLVSPFILQHVINWNKKAAEAKTDKVIHTLVAMVKCSKNTLQTAEFQK